MLLFALLSTAFCALAPLRDSHRHGRFAREHPCGTIAGPVTSAGSTIATSQPVTASSTSAEASTLETTSTTPLGVSFNTPSTTTSAMTSRAGETTSSPVTSIPESPSEIILSSDGVVLFRDVGDTFQIFAHVSLNSSSVIVYTSSAPFIVSVSSTGQLLLLRKNVTTITITLSAANCFPVLVHVVVADLYNGTVIIFESEAQSFNNSSKVLALVPNSKTFGLMTGNVLVTPLGIFRVVSITQNAFSVFASTVPANVTDAFLNLSLDLVIAAGAGFFSTATSTTRRNDFSCAVSLGGELAYSSALLYKLDVGPAFLAFKLALMSSLDFKFETPGVFSFGATLTCKKEIFKGRKHIVWGVFAHIAFDIGFDLGVNFETSFELPTFVKKVVSTIGKGYDSALGFYNIKETITTGPGPNPKAGASFSSSALDSEVSFSPFVGLSFGVSTAELIELNFLSAKCGAKFSVIFVRFFLVHFLLTRVPSKVVYTQPLDPTFAQYVGPRSSYGLFCSAGVGISIGAGTLGKYLGIEFKKEFGFGLQYEFPFATTRAPEDGYPYLVGWLVVFLGFLVSFFPGRICSAS